MGLAIALLTWLWNRGEATRVGRAINTAVATVIVAWAVLVALCLTNLLILAALGYYP